MKKITVISLLAIAVWGCSHKTAPPATATGNATVGKDVYTAKCGRCHGLKDPTHFTAAQWQPIMDEMARKAHLTDAEKSDALAYVLANAKK